MDIADAKKKLNKKLNHEPKIILIWMGDIGNSLFRAAQKAELQRTEGEIACAEKETENADRECGQFP